MIARFPLLLPVRLKFEISRVCLSLEANVKWFSVASPWDFFFPRPMSNCRRRGSGRVVCNHRRRLFGVAGVCRGVVMACVPVLLAVEHRDGATKAVHDGAALHLHYAGGVGRHVQAVHGEHAGCSVFSCRSKAADRSVPLGRLWQSARLQEPAEAYALACAGAPVLPSTPSRHLPWRTLRWPTLPACGMSWRARRWISQTFVTARDIT